MSEFHIPEKQYFKIGEVSSLTELEPYVLRYWETEFKNIRPVRMGSNQRMYRRRDLETILEIKHLLYDEGFTIAGAKKKILQQRGEKEPHPVKGPDPVPPAAPKKRDEMRSLLLSVRHELEEIRQLLSR